jgi:hypothetical protein
MCRSWQHACVDYAGRGEEINVSVKNVFLKQAGGDETLQQESPQALWATTHGQVIHPTVLLCPKVDFQAIVAND